MEYVYMVVFAVAVVVFVSRPFWRGERATSVEDPVIAALEAAREAKYREIKDADSDLASGKMSQEDFDRVNADLRREAVEILEKLDRARGKTVSAGDRGAEDGPETPPSAGEDTSGPSAS